MLIFIKIFENYNKINYYKEAYIAEADSLRKNGKGDKIRSGEIQTSKGYNLTKKYSNDYYIY